MVVGRQLSYWVLVTFQGRAVKLWEGNISGNDQILRKLPPSTSPLHPVDTMCVTNFSSIEGSTVFTKKPEGFVVLEKKRHGFSFLQFPIGSMGLVYLPTFTHKK